MHDATANVGPPKLFVSYSWTSPEHEEWVLQLATELRESGVDVIFDKWHLKEGQDAIAFMESMVSDESIRKVAMICDRLYAEKANARKGGVGTEAQIISAEIYGRHDQEKFVAVVTERDEDGRLCLPIYYRSRKYIDLTDPATEMDGRERLLRWIFDQPFYKIPEVGEKPRWLKDEESAVSLTTSHYHRRALDAIRTGRSYAEAAVAEYFERLSSEMGKLEIGNSTGPLDDAVVASIDFFLPYCHEATEIFLAIARFRPDTETFRQLRRFLEGLLLFTRPDRSSLSENEDNYRFIVHELFLCAVAALLREERFSAVADLLGRPYFVPSKPEIGGPAVLSFPAFWRYLRSLERRNERLKANRLSLHSDLLYSRHAKGRLTPHDVMQADFVAFVHTELHADLHETSWYPVTLLYAARMSGPFEIFARATSLSYCRNLQILFEIDDLRPLNAFVTNCREGKVRLPSWEGHRFDPARLIGFETLGKRP